MIFAALAALAAGAVAGIFLAVRHFLRQRLPAWVALLHGLGGATGFAIVLLIVVREPAFELARQALYLLIVTVALGVVNLLFHVRKVRHRTSLIVMHALCAVSGVGTLLYAAFVPGAEPAAAAAPAATSTVTARASEQAAAPSPPSPTPAPASPSASVAALPSAAASAAPSAEKPAERPASHAAATPLPLDTIRFDSASSDLSPAALASLKTIAATLNAHPELSLVEVQGHADDRGEDFRNIQLTRARAQVVVELLVSQGVARTRLHAAGYGARCPVDPACQRDDAPASCHEPERQQEDRRVVFVELRRGDTAFKGELVCARGAPLIPPADHVFYAPAPG